MAGVIHILGHALYHVTVDTALGLGIVLLWPTISWWVLPLLAIPIIILADAVWHRYVERTENANVHGHTKPRHPIPYRVVG